MAIDFVSDFTRLFRLGKKLAEGDMTVNDLLSGEEESPTESEPAKTKAKAACKKTPGCVEGAGHSGRCCIDVTVEEVK